MAFETPFAGVWTATMTTEVQDPDGHLPTTIIQTDDDWRVHVDWELAGPMVLAVEGEWHVSAHLESIGLTGFEGQVGSTQDVNLNVSVVNPRVYSVDIDVAAGAVPAGSYRLVTLINYTRMGGAPDEMAGFEEGPILQFYDPA